MWSRDPASTNHSSPVHTGHAASLQLAVSSASPSQPRPERSRQSRCRDLWPPPHVALQSVHGAQGDQAGHAAVLQSSVTSASPAQLGPESRVAAHVRTLVRTPPPHDTVHWVQGAHSVHSGHVSSPHVSVSSAAPSQSPYCRPFRHSRIRCLLPPPHVALHAVHGVQGVHAGHGPAAHVSRSCAAPGHGRSPRCAMSS